MAYLVEQRGRKEAAELLTAGTQFYSRRRLDPLGKFLNHPAMDGVVRGLQVLEKSLVRLPFEAMDAPIRARLDHRGRRDTRHPADQEPRRTHPELTLEHLLDLTFLWRECLDPQDDPGGANPRDPRSRLARYEDRTALAGYLTVSRIPETVTGFGAGWRSEPPSATELMAIELVCDQQQVPTNDEAERQRRLDAWSKALKVAKAVIAGKASGKKPGRYMTDEPPKSGETRIRFSPE